MYRSFGKHFLWIDKLSLKDQSQGITFNTKTCFCKVDSALEEQAKAIFSDLKINVVTGFKFIGGFRGSGNDIEKWLIEKVQKWVSCVHSLASAAEEFPHSAHTVLTKSLQHEWDILCV